MNHSYEQIRQEILQQLQWVLGQWSNEVSEGSTMPDPDGATRVRDSVSALSIALKSLADRDRHGARQGLTVRRNTLKTKLALFESLGRWLKGPGGIALVNRVLNAREAVDTASAALLLATRENVRELREAVDMANVELNAVILEIDKLRTTDLVYPNRSILDPALVQRAKIETAALSADPRRAVSLHLALEQGRGALEAEAMIWIAFENDPACSELYALRFERWIAAHPEAVAA